MTFSEFRNTSGRYTGNNIFRNGKTDQKAIREELLRGIESVELSNNGSKEQDHHQMDEVSANDLELVPLNSPTSLSTTPDILIDPTKIEEKNLNGNTKKRSVRTRLAMTLSKKKSEEGDEKNNVKLDDETKQVTSEED